jgi:hypothetical protein
VLKFTFGKVLILMNVLRVLDMAKNMMSDDLLNNRGFRLLYGSDKFILNKNVMFVGRVILVMA